MGQRGGARARTNEGVDPGGGGFLSFVCVTSGQQQYRQFHEEGENMAWLVLVVPVCVLVLFMYTYVMQQFDMR